MDQGRRSVGKLLGLCSAQASSASGCAQRRVAAPADGSLDFGAIGKGEASAIAGSGQSRIVASRIAGPDRIAAHAGRTGGVSGGYVQGQLRETGGPVIGLAALWRALGFAMAGSCPVWRHQGL